MNLRDARSDQSAQPENDEEKQKQRPIHLRLNETRDDSNHRYNRNQPAPEYDFPIKDSTPRFCLTFAVTAIAASIG